MVIRPLEICLIAENRFVKTKKLQYGPKICFCASEVVLRRSWGQGMHFECRCCPSAVRCVEGGRGGSPCARALSGGCLRHRWERALCRRKRCDLLRRPYCENEKSPIVGALRVRWDSRGFRFGDAIGFTRLHRILAVAGFSPTLLESLVVTSFARSRWAPGCAGPPNPSG